MTTTNKKNLIRKFVIQEKSKDFSSLVNFPNSNKKFTITKKIAKHGSQAIIVIPRVLEEQLKPGTLAEISINIIEDYEKIVGGEEK